MTLAALALPVQLSPSASSLRHMMRANAEHGFIYLNNPKVGCSTIKSALWSGITGSLPRGGGKGAHDRQNSPFVDWFAQAEGATDCYVFTAIRNPFQRIVSAYLNKIAPARGQNWEGFRKRAGLPDQPVSFATFVEVLEGQERDHFDPHWRPQCLNVLVPFLEPNLLVDLEALDLVMPEILQRIFPGKPMPLPGKTARVHSTNARDTWRSHLSDPATLRRVVGIYSNDFEAFGYAPDLAAPPSLAEPVKRSPARHHGLAALLRFWSVEPKDRPPLLRAIEAADRSGNLRAWALSQRLGFFARNPSRQAEILAAHPDLLAAPTAVLKRAVERFEQGLAPDATSED